jgi:hypothetical protein
MFSDVPPKVRELFDRSGLLDPVAIRTFEDLDRAVEWVEDAVLLESRQAGAHNGHHTEPAWPGMETDIHELLR